MSDRIDIHIEVPAARYQELSSNLPAESSAQIKERVNKARATQRERFKDTEKSRVVEKIISECEANLAGTIFITFGSTSISSILLFSIFSLWPRFDLGQFGLGH